MSAIQTRLQAVKEQVFALIEEKAALRITYDTISPNLLGGLRLKGVSVSDSLTGDTILSVHQLSVSWKLGRINFRDVNDILSHIRNVTVEGFTLDWDNEAQAALVQKLAGAPKEKSPSGNSSFSLQLPFTVTLKSLIFRYRQPGFSAEVILPQLKLTPGRSGSTDVSVNGTATVLLDQKILDSADTFHVSFKARGTLAETLTGSLARLEITSDEGDWIRLGTTALSARLQDDCVEATLVSAKQPYSLTATYNLKGQTVSASLMADQFKPLHLVTIRSSNDLFRKLQDLAVSGSYTVAADLHDLKNSVRYQAQGNVQLPAALLKGGLTVSVDASGDGTRVAARQVSVRNPSMDISYTGSFTFASLTPEGELSINRFALPSGRDLETLFYIDRLPGGFVMFAPQVYAGETALTAVQAEVLLHDSSVDFTIEASDYSHYELETPGVISLQGFASWENGVDVQAAVSLNNLFGDSIVELVNCALPEKAALGEGIRNGVAPFIVSLDVYATTDFKGIVYNVPVAVVANTSRADQMLLLSLGGNETTISVSQCNLLYGGQEISATISADADADYNQVFFGTSLTLNGMPYSLSGVFMDRQVVSLQGDYGLDAEISFGKKGITGSLLFQNLPAVVGSYTFQASMDAGFEYRSLKDFSVSFTQLALSETSGAIRVQPAVALSGSLDQWGMTVSQITFSDTVDVLLGNGYLSWTLETDEDTGTTILSGGALALSVANSHQSDRVALTATFSNPLKNTFSSGALLRDSYIEAQAELDHFAVAHLLDGQAPEDTVTAMVSLQGSLENPSIYATVPNAAAKFGGSQASASFEASLEDKLAAVMNGSFQFSAFTIDQTDAFFDLASGELQVSAEAGMDAFVRASTPFTLNARLSDSDISAELLLQYLETNIASPVENYPVILQRSSGVTALTAGQHEGVQAVLLESGDFYASATAEFPVLFTASGAVSDGNLNIGVDDISFDLSLLSNLINFRYFNLAQGMVTGHAGISGRTTDPHFDGELYVEDMSVGVRAFIDNPINSPVVRITAEENAIYLEGDNFLCDETPMTVEVGFFFDRWSFENLKVHLAMEEGYYTAGRFNQSFLDITGDLNGDLEIMYSTELITVDGTLSARNANAVINNNFLSDGAEDDGDGYKIQCNMVINVENKAQAYYPSRQNPLVRGLVTASTPLVFTYDTIGGTYSISGDLILRGGEILYLNRNFYLREGSIRMNETESGFNPLVNLRAETRERTGKGDLVRIILSVPNQRLRQINPVLSSDSSLSELEIRTLLGEAILVESGTSTGAMLGQLAASGVDYLLQNSLIRGLENRLRDSLHFDIFSIRSPVFQQALINALGENENVESVKIGNYFDNTTVYIGKYIGTSVYMDAMFSFRYDENNAGERNSNFVIQPEIGLEFPAPFANIRWSIAPDLTESVQNLWVPNTSLSLSWKLSL